MAENGHNKGMKNGQAIVELVVALVAVLVLFAGLLQIGLLADAHTAVMTEARRKAGMNAIAGGIGGVAPEYISRWDNGPDRVSYSMDDRCVRGSPALFALLAGEHVAHGMQLQRTVGANAVSSLAPYPETVLSGFQSGRSSTVVPLLPVIRHLVYAQDSIGLQSEVWMVEMKVP